MEKKFPLENVTFDQLVKNPRSFVDHEGSLRRSKEAATELYTEPDESCLQPHTLFP